MPGQSDIARHNRGGVIRALIPYRPVGTTPSIRGLHSTDRHPMGKRLSSPGSLPGGVLLRESLCLWHGVSARLSNSALRRSVNDGRAQCNVTLEEPAGDTHLTSLSSYGNWKGVWS